MTFGANGANFLVNSPAAVAQIVLTRLKLLAGEWFLDVTAGMPWKGQVIGAHTQSTRDEAIKSCILGTQGVTAIAAGTYSSTVSGRNLQVAATLVTAYGAIPFAAVL